MGDRNLDDMGLPILGFHRDPLNDFNWGDLRSPEERLNDYWEGQFSDAFDPIKGAMDVYYEDWDISPEESYYLYCQGNTPVEVDFHESFAKEQFWRQLSNDELNRELILNGFKKPQSNP